MWDFWSLSPESLHQVTILFSDRGTPDGYRHMDGFSSHTFSLINAKNELFYVKWHFKTKPGQARLISYPDAHRYRLGVNYDSLPVNKPQCPFHTYNRDGAMRFDGNSGASVNYEPNSFDGPTQDPAFRERPRPVSGTVDRHNHRLDADYYTQPGNLFRLMKPDARERLIGNIAASLKNAPQRIQELQVQHFFQADPAYGAGVVNALGLSTAKTTNSEDRFVAAD